jgi:hypothetical protein
MLALLTAEQRMFKQAVTDLAGGSWPCRDKQGRDKQDRDEQDRGEQDRGEHRNDVTGVSPR